MCQYCCPCQMETEQLLLSWSREGMQIINTPTHEALPAALLFKVRPLGVFVRRLSHQPFLKADMPWSQSVGWLSASCPLGLHRPAPRSSAVLPPLPSSPPPLLPPSLSSSTPPLLRRVGCNCSPYSWSSSNLVSIPTMWPSCKGQWSSVLSPMTLSLRP